MKEYKNKDGSSVVIGSVADVNVRFAGVPKPPVVVAILPVFEVNQFPYAVVIPSTANSSEGRTVRSIAQQLADRVLVGFGQVALLDDKTAFAEVVLDETQKIKAISILYGTELIPASSERLADFTRFYGVPERSVEQMQQDSAALSLLVSTMWRQQVDRYVSRALPSFCGGCEPRSSSVQAGPFGIWRSSPPPDGAAGAQPARQDELDPRQYQF